MHAIKLILQDHFKVRSIISKLKTSKKGTKARYNNYVRLRNELLRHETMEQKMFYPTIKKNAKLGTKINHLLTEETSAEKMLKKIEKEEFQTKEWNKHVDKLMQDVAHHAREEELTFFPRVLVYVSNEVLLKVGKKMQKFRSKINKIKSNISNKNIADAKKIIIRKL